MSNPVIIGDATLYCGDALQVLPTLPAGSVQCCVTSPPYWGLRDYGTAEWDGGDEACDHRMPIRQSDSRASTLQSNKSTPGLSAGTEAIIGHRQEPYRAVCGKCDARRIDRQFGLEPIITEYVANMVAVFRLVRDALADDGVLFLNLGDSYHTGAGNGFSARGRGEASAMQVTNAGSYIAGPNRMPQAGLKPKDMCGIPWRTAFALQADGWYLRSDIIWHKPNPMPESVTDRPTKAHEYLFLLAKSERYYYDAAAIADPASTYRRQNTSGVLSPKTIALQNNGTHGKGGDLGVNYERDTRNRRTVWTIATQPYPEAHFATFPEALVEPCILAGSRVGDTVLDPFGGAGTTALVADRLQRNSVLIELNPQYAAMARNRVYDDAPLFSDRQPVQATL